jgi:hypothetical protein
MTVVPVAHHANVDARTDVRIAIVGKYVESYVYNSNLRDQDSKGPSLYVDILEEFLGSIFGI